MRGEGQIGWIMMCTGLTEPEFRFYKSSMYELVWKFHVDNKIEYRLVIPLVNTT